MITQIITKAQAGRRLDRYIKKILPEMPESFLRRQLRENGFRLNGIRVHDGSRVLETGDELRIFLNDAQLRSFGYQTAPSAVKEELADLMPPIVYEDDQILIVNKPAGMLSQKDRSADPSLAEIGAAYLHANGLAADAGFTPGVCNRLDRATTGLVLMGKTLRSQQALMQMIRDRWIEKTYYAIVEGSPEWNGWTRLTHHFEKDGKANRVRLSEAEPEQSGVMISDVRRVQVFPKKKASLIEVRLVTGKTHQIRSQLQFMGYPIVGDPKYNPGTGSRQLLCARELFFVKAAEPLKYLQGRHFYAEMPQDMNTYLVDPK